MARINVIVTICDSNGYVLDNFRAGTVDHDIQHKAIENETQLANEIRERLEMKFEIEDEN